MSAIGSEIKNRYQEIKPSTALMHRTEQMMEIAAEQRESAAHRRQIGSVAAALAVLSVLIALIVLPNGYLRDHVRPLSDPPGETGEITSLVTIPAFAPDSRKFTLNETSVLSPADAHSVELAEGVTLDVHTIGTTKDGVFAEWTVRSSLPETVYYSLEYDISFSGDLPADYLYSGGIDRSADCFRSGSDDALLSEAPPLYALTPDTPENSGSFLHTYSSNLPENEISVRFVLHAYTAKDGEIADWGEQDAATAHAKKYIPLSKHLGDMRVFGLADGSRVNNIPAYQDSLIALQEEKGADSMIYLEALTKSGVFGKVSEVAHEYISEDQLFTNKTVLNGLEFKLPDRTVNVSSLSITPDTIEIQYTVAMDELEYSADNAALVENTLFYIMDDEGWFVASAAEGNTIEAGLFSASAYEAPNGMQAYSCWLRLNTDLAAMPEYFVFAPHRSEVGQYSGTNAVKFEYLFSVTAPEECFAVTPDGEIVALHSRAQESSGIRFTLDSTECTSGRIGMEWTVESSLEHDIIYFIESEFIPADGVWDLDSSGSYSVDFAGVMALFDPPGKLLTPDEPAFSGHRSYDISSTEPCPGGEVVLTLRAFRAPDKSSLSGDFYPELLMDLYNQSGENPGRYASLIADSGLFVEETTLVQRFSVPPYENATKAMIENTQFDFDGLTITIRYLRVTPTGMDMRYEISGADFSAYTGEREYEDMYFVVTAYGSAVGLGHIDKSTSAEGVRCGVITESDWNLEKIPEYIVLVPYGPMSADEYMELRKSRHSGEMFERLREIYYHETDQDECIRIYMDGRVTTNALENRRTIRTRTVEDAPPLSTISEPKEPAEFTRIDPALIMNPVSDPAKIGSMLALGEREILFKHAGIDDGCVKISSVTDEESIFHIDYTVYAPVEEDEYGERDGWKFSYFPVFPDGTLPKQSAGYGSILEDENGDTCIPQNCSVLFPKDDVPEYITFIPWQQNYLNSSLSLAEQDAVKLEDAAVADPAQCFRLVITNTGDAENPEYNFAISPVLIDGPYTYESFFESQGRRVGIFRSEFGKNSQYIAYSYAVHADEYEKYLDAENYDGLYFAAIISGGETQFISGHKGISTTGGEEYWQGVINGNLQFDAAPDEILLVPYPDGLTKDAFVQAKADGKVDDMLRGFFEQADPDDCIPLFTSASDAQT